VPILNIILYYSRSVPSYKANQMEIYWPLALILSAMTVRQVYQASMSHLATCKQKKSVQITYDKAHLAILEANSSPNVRILLEDSNGNTWGSEISNEEQLHPTLLQISITSSVIQVQSITKYFRSNKIVSTFLGLIIIGLASIHASIPTIHRHIKQNGSSSAVPWHIESIRYSYIGFSAVFYTLSIGMMTASIVYYWCFLDALKKLLSSTDLMQPVDKPPPYFFNLHRPENLEYLLGLFRLYKQRIDRHNLFISTMTCALLIDIIFIITAIIRIFAHGRSTDLLLLWCLSDIVILSVFIMLFVTIVVLINGSMGHDFIRRLRILRTEIATSAIRQGDRVDTGDYLGVVIQDMEGVSDAYAVKLLSFVVDYSFAIKVLMSMITGIASCLVPLIQE
jgi:hypothetical protein